MGNFPIDIELRIRVDYDAHKGERQTWNYQGSPPSMEINEIEFVTEADGPLDTLEKLKNYIINQNTDALVDSAWEDHRENTAIPDDYA
jgi:hypothetical protein